MDKLLYLLLLVTCCSCMHNSETEKFQSKRNNVINVRDRIKEIKIEDVLINAYSLPYLIGDYLIISDDRSYDQMIHVFDKKTFNHLASTGYKGEGPGEITILGHIGVDEPNRTFYVTDHGKQAILNYHLDSVLTNAHYMPEAKMSMNAAQFPSKYQYVNDTLCIGIIINPIGHNDFKPTLGKWNMATGAIKLMEYEHPEIAKRRISFAVSMENGIYVECYRYNELMTICALDGKLRCNVYGPKWDNRTSNETFYYGNVAFCKDKILVSYLGDATFSKNQNGGVKSNSATKFLLFELNGDYIQTLEIGYGISNFCYDEENNRLFMSLDDADMQFAYLSLDGLL